MARGDFFRTNATKRLAEMGRRLEDSQAMEDWEILANPALGMKTLLWLRANYPQAVSPARLSGDFPYEECF